MNGAAPALAGFVEDLPADKAIQIVASHVNAQGAQLAHVTQDLAEIKASIRSGVLAIKILAAMATAAAGVGGAIAWLLVHVSVR